MQKNNAIELQLGKMKTKDLAAWFGISPNYLSKVKKEKLEELKTYCDYEIITSATIKINKIYIPIYIKKKSKAYEYYRENVPKAWRIGAVDTCSRVAAQIFKKENNIAYRTGINYTRFVRDEVWGKPDLNNPQCYFVLAKMYYGDKNKANCFYKLFTPEDDKIYKEIYDKYFDTDKKIKQEAIIKDMVDNQEMTKEEAYDLLVNESVYKLFLKELSAALRCDAIVRGTWVDDNALEEQ